MKDNKNIEIDLDQNGRLRSLTTTRKGGLQSLYSCSPTNQLKVKTIDDIDAFYIADEFINSPAIKDCLQSANTELEMGDITPFAFGYRINFRQMATYPAKKLFLPVYGGGINLAMNKEGEIFSLSSTIQYEKIRTKPEKLISQSDAVLLACAHCQYEVDSAGAAQILLAHDDELTLAYEITLVCSQPARSYTSFVLANTGKIIEQRKRAHEFRPYKRCSTISSLIKARALLKTPDANKPLSEQISKVLVEHLPNPQVLRNAYLDMFTGKEMNMVYAKDDGSYCYSSNQPEFSAVSVFISLRNQIELYLQSGMVEPDQALMVVVNDSKVKDNAFFDPISYEIHLGVGTGPDRGGLTRHIAYDLGVANHEFGHVLAYWQTVNRELAGAQGIAINEAVGDVLGALVMDYLSAIWYADQLGHQLSKHDLKNDARVIGKYALPPFGIRTQKNSCKLPDDLKGEPHADGLIIGGALADLLIAMATFPDVEIEEQIRLFVKMSLMALALLPGYKVMFTDMLRAMITADQQLCGGQYRSTIEHCFGKHGIVIDTANKGA